MAVKAVISVKELQMQLRHHSLDQVNLYLRQLGMMDCIKTFAIISIALVTIIPLGLG